ncbi:MAG TPA: hypothetical protein VFT74_11610, partial [Isosphaeraceae bacterium]|nr:hypothetical protein [Isosphaeraceae bacterium]
DRLNEQLAREIEPGAHVEGQPGRFSIKTALGSGSALNHLDGSLALKFSQIDIYGMKLADFALSAQAENGKVVIDPVAATLNGGQVYLEPLLERGDDGVWTLRLSSASRVSGAEVNDEVSRRVLSYIAPVLDRATRVNGRISATFDRAEFPLGPDLARSTRVEGRVVFDDVAFEPGPLANNIMALAGREAKTITLDEPVLLTIADGKVHQTGLTVPIGNLTEFSLVGDVGFDRSLDLKASLPMTSQMVGNLPVVGSIVDGARITVPIGGTLANPRIDRDEFREELKVLERNLLQRTATQGAADLLFRLAQPRPRGEDGLTPRERRQQKRMERRQQRDGAARP